MRGSKVGSGGRELLEWRTGRWTSYWSGRPISTLMSELLGHDKGGGNG